MKHLAEAIKVMNDASSVLIVAGRNSNHDILASLITLKLLFEEKEKKSTGMVTNDVEKKFSEFFKKYDVSLQDELQPLNYTISVPFSDGEIERVSYDTKDGQVNLYITPGATQFDFDSVKYKVSGSSFDLILTIGVTDLQELGQIYSENKHIFDSTKIIALGNKALSSEFAELSLIDEKKQSISEIAYDLVSLLGGTQNEKILNSLLEGTFSSIDLKNPETVAENTSNTIVNLINGGADLKLSLESFVNLNSDNSPMQPETPEEKTPEVSEVSESNLEVSEEIEPEEPVAVATPELEIEEKPKQKTKKFVKKEKELKIETQADDAPLTNALKTLGIKKRTISDEYEIQKPDKSQNKKSGGYIAPPTFEKSKKIPLVGPNRPKGTQAE